METTARNITVGVTATAAAVAAYYFLCKGGVVSKTSFVLSSSSVLTTLITQGSGNDEPVLSHDDTVEAMVKVLDGLRTIAVQHVRAAENIKEQLMQQGQDMSREEIMTTIILPHFKNAFAAMQVQVLEVRGPGVHGICVGVRFLTLLLLQDYDVDEEELEACVDHYLENVAVPGSKIGEVVSKIKAICAQFTGEATAGQARGGSSGPAKELSLDVLMDVLGAFGAKTKEYFGRFAEDFVSQHGVPSNQEQIVRFGDELTLVSDRSVLTSIN